MIDTEIIKTKYTEGIISKFILLNDIIAVNSLIHTVRDKRIPEFNFYRITSALPFIGYELFIRKILSNDELTGEVKYDEKKVAFIPISSIVAIEYEDLEKISDDDLIILIDSYPNL